MSSFDQEEFGQNIGKPINSHERIYNASIFRHEMAHWIDHISTLWGHNSLLLLYNALNARATKNLNEFWRIKFYADSCKQDTLFDYFTEIHNQIDGSRHNRWSYNFSTGFRFQSNGYVNQEKPILFTTFRANEEKIVARVPISIVSILETIATKEEFKLKFQSISLIEDVVERKRLEKLYEEELFKLIYNSKLTLYNVVAHLTANIAKASDIIWALEVSSSVGTVVLNLPDKEIDKVLEYKTGIAEIDSRITAFKKSKDKGYLFYNLLVNLVNTKGSNHYNIQDLIQSSNLSDIAVIEQQIIESMESNIKNLIPGPFFHRARKILEYGIQIFKLRGLDGKKEGYEFKVENFPQRPNLMFGDTFYNENHFNLQVAIEKLNNGLDLNLDEEYFLFEYYQKKLDEFINICGI